MGRRLSGTIGRSGSLNSLSTEPSSCITEVLSLGGKVRGTDLAQEAGFKVDMVAGKTERVGVNPSDHSRRWRLLSLALVRQCGPATPTLKRLRQEHHEFQVIP